MSITDYSMYPRFWIVGLNRTLRYHARMVLERCVFCSCKETLTNLDPEWPHAHPVSSDERATAVHVYKQTMAERSHDTCERGGRQSSGSDLGGSLLLTSVSRHPGPQLLPLGMCIRSSGTAPRNMNALADGS